MNISYLYGWQTCRQIYTSQINYEENYDWWLKMFFYT